MTPSSSPVQEASDQERPPDPTTTPEHGHSQQPGRDDEPRPQRLPLSPPADQAPTQDQVATTVAELQGLSLNIDTCRKGKNEVNEAVGDEDSKGRDTDASPEPPASPFDDPEDGSQTSSEESWASFPSSGSCSTDSISSTDGQRAKDGLTADAPLPSPETTFKFHEEFSSHGGVDDNYGLEPLPPPPRTVGDGDEFAVRGEDQEEDLAYSPPGLWSTSAVPRWAFLRSSNSLPVLGLGPGDFYHGGSALRHEITADEVEVEDEDEDDVHGSSYVGAENRGSQEMATVGVVHL
jgi:hypothetical protein